MNARDPLSVNNGALAELDETLDMNKEAARGLIDETIANASSQTVSTQELPPPIPTDYYVPADSIRYNDAPPAAPPQEVLFDAIDCSNKGDSLGKRESASWLGSVVVHAAILILLWLLLAPADFGGIGTQQLFVTLTQEENDLPEGVFEFAVTAADDIGLDDVSPLPEEPIPMAVSLDGILAASDMQGTQGGRGGAGGSEAAGGSFFGIAAEGHDFVYVLDMSGSMEGRRFEQATAELVRSVSELRESQNFYVLLFSQSTVQMFGESSILPASVAATPANKRKLSRWLTTAYKGGSTDPRGALRLALRMKPSAVFMLSDGEFDDQKKNKKKKAASLTGGHVDTFALVAAASANVPIHAIAFEDPKSCENMKRLADMTEGQYRFAELEDGNSVSDSMALARQAVRVGDTATATILMSEIVSRFGETKEGWEARKELASILGDFADEKLTDGNLEEAINTFIKIVDMDPETTVSGDIQQSLLEKFLQLLQPEPGREVEASTIALLVNLSSRFPKSMAAERIAGPVAELLLKEAREFRTSDDTMQAMKRFDQIVRQYPTTAAAKECQAELQQMTEGLLSHAQQLRETSGDVVCAKYLRQLVSSYSGTQVSTVANEALEELGREMLTKVRDASFERDFRTRDTTNRQLKAGFSIRTLSRLRREFTRNEVGARELMRRAERLEKAAKIDDALERYNDIVKNYSNTIAAKSARERLRALGVELRLHDVATDPMRMNAGPVLGRATDSPSPLLDELTAELFESAQE